MWGHAFELQHFHDAYSENTAYTNTINKQHLIRVATSEQKHEYAQAPPSKVKISAIIKAFPATIPKTVYRAFFDHCLMPSSVSGKNQGQEKATPQNASQQ